MTLQGRSDRFLQRFFEEDLNIRSQDLDVLRSLALFVGEEACLQYFYKKEFRLAQVQNFLEEWSATKRFKRLPELEALVSERERLQKKAEEQIEFLLKERAYLQRQKEKEGAEASFVSRKAEEPFLKKREGQKERKRKRTGTLWRLFSFFFPKKAAARKKKEQAGILKLLTNPAYNPKQLQVLISAVQNRLPLREIQRIGDPNLSAENMELLEAFLCAEKEVVVQDEEA